MDLITPEWGLIFWTGISFLILLFILGKFAWKPILKSVNDREGSILEALEQAEKAKREMENLQADNQNALKEARAEREAMLKEAREIKEKLIATAKEEAQLQAGKMIEQAQTAIESEKKAAMTELKNHVASLSVEIAEKVVRNELSNKGKQLKLVEDMLDEAILN
jgi:F-type H+-transporting ATPase subunit b